MPKVHRSATYFSLNSGTCIAACVPYFRSKCSRALFLISGLCAGCSTPYLCKLVCFAFLLNLFVTHRPASAVLLQQCVFSFRLYIAVKPHVLNSVSIQARLLLFILHTGYVRYAIDSVSLLHSTLCFFAYVLAYAVLSFVYTSAFCTAIHLHRIFSAVKCFTALRACFPMRSVAVLPVSILKKFPAAQRTRFHV